MSASVVKVSVVCPAYEEEEVLPLFHAELLAVLDGLGGEYSFEILYVDDGSRDGTLAVLRQLAAADGRVRYLSLSRNFGQQAALTAGLEHARGDVVISLDADLQHPPALIPTLLHKWREGFEVVLTLREEDPNLSVFKRLTSRAFYRVMSWISETEIRAAAADFRLLGRKAVDALLRMRETDRFLRGMVNWLGFPMTMVPYRPASRKAGVSKYSLRRMLRLATAGMVSFSKVPLRVALVVGAITLAVGMVFTAGVLLAAALGYPPSSWGIAITIALLLVLDGCVLCGLGILGEYVGRVFDQVKGRPLYLLKESSPEPSSGLASQPFAPPLAGCEKKVA